MRNWSNMVEQQLPPRRPGSQREAAIRRELAAHLEEAYADAIHRGCSEADAEAHALACVPDWDELAVSLRRHDYERVGLSPQTRTVLLPGLTTLVATVAFLAFMLRSPAQWADPRWYVHAFAAVLAVGVYLACGAAGAAWSRRAGGTPRERLAAGVFPGLLHVAVVGPAIAASILSKPPQAALNVQPGVILALVIVPSVALALGALPFVRRSKATS